MIWTDEFYVLESDSVSSALTLVRHQLVTPISLDPIVYNLLAHGAIDLFGVGAFAIRLPSLCGYLLMQVCLFYFVRRIAGERAALFAIAFPAVIGNFSYAMQARPYGVLLGWVGLAMVSWQTVTRRSEGQRRTGVLVVLALSIALAINTHYYGVLLLVPLWGAELFRSLERGKLDYAVLIALGAGTAGILAVMPFARAVAPFQAHYFDTRQVEFHFITHTYPWLIVGYADVSTRVQHGISALLALVLALLIWGYVALRKGTGVKLPRAEGLLLGLLAALPVFGFLLARFVTKVVEGRYVLPAIFGITALLALLMEPFMRDKRRAAAMLAVLFLAIAGTGALRVHAARQDRAREMRAMTLAPEVVRQLRQTPDKPIYLINPALFQVLGFYAPYPDLKSRLRLVYSRDDEMRVRNSDHTTLTAINMESVMPGKIETWESLTKEPRPQTLLLFHDPAYDWTDTALARDGAKEKSLGQGFYGGDLVEVQFVP